VRQERYGKSNGKRKALDLQIICPEFRLLRNCSKTGRTGVFRIKIREGGKKASFPNFVCAGMIIVYGAENPGTFPNKENSQLSGHKGRT
jgi:hypothetical protein